jgi:hypothetical protein
MFKIKNDSENIKQFIVVGLERFSKEVRKPVMMGIYCCPWSGWITLNFNISYKFNKESYYCPDFEFVEYNMLEFKHWEKEYLASEGIWTDDTLKVYHTNHDKGDDGLNKFFFDYLKDLIVTLNEKYKLPPTLLEFLDSNCREKVI